MTCEGAMVLPRGAALMQEEEMRYVEGGAIHLGQHTWNSISFVGTAIDVVLIAAGFAISKYSASKAIKMVKNTEKLTRVVRNELSRLIGASAVSAFSAALNMAATIVGSSIGGLIAIGLGRIDSKPKDKYIFA